MRFVPEAYLCLQQQRNGSFVCVRTVGNPDAALRAIGTTVQERRYHAAKPMAAGVAATEGDLVFTGELTGDLLALDARTGKVLLRRALGGPAGGGVVTYNARGVQNVAIVSGFVGIYNSVAPEIGGGNTSVTIFRLPGK